MHWLLGDDISSTDHSDQQEELVTVRMRKECHLECRLAWLSLAIGHNDKPKEIV